jgi:hypothetical protein
MTIGLKGAARAHARPGRDVALGIAATAGLLALGLLPTEGQGTLRAALRGAHALDLNHADHEKHATGYYVGLIDGDTPGRDELALALLGKPNSEDFKDIGATKYLYGDVLQFELLPSVDARAFGRPFTTNRSGLRDREYDRAKPPGVFRIALLGSSMDMGWGVETDQTYENQLEDWLNAHAAKHGLTRRFEVLNFAMAAYSPLHRLETFERKARDFQPDLVLYSATRLDTRLLQIHLVNLLQERLDPKFDFARDAYARAGIDEADRRLDRKGRLLNKERVKQKLEPRLWAANEAALARLADDCRGAGIPLALVMIPRASEDDGPGYRGPDEAKILAIAGRLGLPTLDVMDAYDETDPGALEIAPWDDHPNADGHRLLFLAMGRKIVEDAPLYRLIFDADPADLGPIPAK